MRARASMRGNPSAGGHGANKKPSPLTALSPIPVSPTPPSPKPERRQEPTPPKPERRQELTPPKPKPTPSKEEITRRKSLEAKKAAGYEVSPPRRISEDVLSIPGQMAKSSKEPIPVPRSPKHISPKQQSTSPELSDSDPEENYTNFSFFEMQPKQRSRSTGSSSFSEDGPRRPVATPRKSKSPSLREPVSPIPPLPPKPDSTVETCPPLPPRPINIPKISKQNSLPDEPARPMRPRPSEIKRAKGRARAANPKNKSPMLTIVDEHGFETMSTVSAKSSKSTASISSSKSAPPGNTKARTQTDASQYLVPDTEHSRNKRRSANNNQPQEEIASSAPGSVGGDLMAGGLDTQVADKLLKYLISSDDPNVKAVLRDLVKESAMAGKQ